MPLNSTSTTSIGKIRERDSAWSVFRVFLRLGLTSFGRPIAHLGYFRDEFVTRRRWLTERSYADLVALCQFLPGPASSQVGMALGLSRSGYSGALAAWAGFTLPSAIAMILFALGVTRYGDAIAPGTLHGLKVVAVAVVAQAVWGMGRNLCPDVLRATFMAIAACFILLVPSAWGQVGVIAVAGVAGLLLFKPMQAGCRARSLACRGQPPCRGYLAVVVLRPAGRFAGLDQTVSGASRGDGGCLLPRRVTGIRWGTRRAAAVASRSRAARLDRQ